MKPKNLSKLLVVDLLFIFEGWIKDPSQTIILGSPTLAPWLAGMKQHHSQLLTFKPTNAALGTTVPQRDRRAEASVRVLNLALLIVA